MAECDLIERNKIFEKVTELYRYSKGDMHIAYRELLDYILDMPATDVQPVKRGHWIKTDYGMFYECSKCGNIQEFKRNYCSKCGADMRIPESIKG